MKVILDREVWEELQRVAKEAYPKEMFLFLEGKYEKKQDIVRIHGLTYQPYAAGSYHALVRADLPLINNVIGTIHSHPSSNTRPSNADLNTWKRYGKAHFIIGSPYEQDSLVCYDENGNKLSYSIS